MLPANKVPGEDRQGSSFQDYEQQPCSWMRTPHLEPSKRAVASILRATSAARRVRKTAAGDNPESRDGALRILEISKNVFALEAAGSIYQEVARFLHYRRTDQSVGEFIA